MLFLNIVSMLLIFILVGAFTYWGIHTFLNRGIEDRLNIVRKGGLVALQQTRSSQISQWMKLFLFKFTRFSIPEDTNQLSSIKMKLTNAGYRGESPLIIYYGFKTLFAFFIPVLYLVYSFIYLDRPALLSSSIQLIVLCAMGYYLPNFFLKLKISKRKRLLFESFPDAIDLIRICVSSGLGIEAAISRVGSELHIISKELAEEFDILAMELRAGATRHDAFSHLALRCDIDDIKALVAMLMQASRFGTSVSESLYVYSEGLRTKRKLLAQEAAAKIPVKISLPLVLCIFPAIFVVTLGPAIINLVRIAKPF